MQTRWFKWVQELKRERTRWIPQTNQGRVDLRYEQAAICNLIDHLEGQETDHKSHKAVHSLRGDGWAISNNLLRPIVGHYTSASSPASALSAASR